MQLTRNLGLKINAYVLGIFGLGAVLFPHALLFLSHNESPDLQREVHAVLRGWGAAAVSLSFIAYMMMIVNHDIAKKMVIRGCLLQFALVMSGQVLTMQYKTNWNTPAGYILLLAEMILTAINAYFGFVLKDAAN